MMEAAQERGGADVEVSVIIANYNGSNFLADAIRSACAQTLRDIEVIVSDDASSDGSAAIVRQLMDEDPRVRLVESRTNGGAAAARNRAIDVARGRWIAILDSDDLMHPDRLRSLLLACATTGADMIADDLLLFDNERRTAPQTLLDGAWAKQPRRLSARDYLAANNLYGGGPAFGYLKPIIRSSLLAEHSIRYDERLVIAEDYNLVMRLLLAGARFWIVPQLGYFYRRHGASLSHRLNALALTRMRDVEQHWTTDCPSPELRPLFEARARSVARAIAFDVLVQALKARNLPLAARTAIHNPAAAALLRIPLRDALKRRFFRSKPIERPERQQICILSRQRITGRNNGSSRYLIEIAAFLAAKGYDVHLLVPSPAMMGRWPFLKLSADMDVFKTIKVRGTFRAGRYVIGRDPRLAIRASIAILDRLLLRSGILSRSFSRPASYAIAQPMTREDQLFVAREAPAISDVQIADYCFLTDAYPYALRPDARRLVIMHDLFSSRAAQFARLNTADTVVSLSLDQELRLLAAADTVVAIQRDEAAMLRRELPHQKIIVAPIAIAPVDEPQEGTAQIVLFVGSATAPNSDGIRWFIETCWPAVRAERPDALLLIAGSVCNAVSSVPPATRLLGVVDDLDHLYTEAAVVISPLRAGSGLKVKLIEGLSKGKAMVVTSTTLQGVSEVLGGCVLVEDTASHFASAVVALLGDVGRRKHLGAAGLKAVAQHFSPEHAYADIVAAIQGSAPQQPDTSLRRVAS
jgi:GT2 family glycosyltransferase/glycosyltransferase involved in cell wall biosynthesis